MNKIDMRERSFLIEDKEIEIDEREEIVKGEEIEIGVIGKKDENGRKVKNGEIGLENLRRMVEKKIVGDRRNRNEGKIGKKKENLMDSNEEEKRIEKVIKMKEEEKKSKIINVQKLVNKDERVGDEGKRKIERKMRKNLKEGCGIVEENRM